MALVPRAHIAPSDMVPKKVGGSRQVCRVPRENLADRSSVSHSLVHCRNHPKKINLLSPNCVIFRMSPPSHLHLFSDSLGLCCYWWHPMIMLKHQPLYFLSFCWSGGSSSHQGTQGATTSCHLDLCHTHAHIHTHTYSLCDFPRPCLPYPDSQKALRSGPSDLQL